MATDCKATKETETSYINRLDGLQQSLLASHSILDNLLGATKSENSVEPRKEPACLTDKLYQLIEDNYTSANNLNFRLQNLISKF
jgi:hypothetical protein